MCSATHLSWKQIMKSCSSRNVYCHITVILFWQEVLVFYQLARKENNILNQALNSRFFSVFWGARNYNSFCFYLLMHKSVAVLQQWSFMYGKMSWVGPNRSDNPLVPLLEGWGQHLLWPLHHTNYKVLLPLSYYYHNVSSWKVHPCGRRLSTWKELSAFLSFCALLTLFLGLSLHHTEKNFCQV